MKSLYLYTSFAPVFRGSYHESVDELSPTLERIVNKIVWNADIFELTDVSTSYVEPLLLC